MTAATSPPKLIWSTDNTRSLHRKNSVGAQTKVKISMIFPEIPLIFLKIPLIFLQISMIFWLFSAQWLCLMWGAAKSNLHRSRFHSALPPNPWGCTAMCAVRRGRFCLPDVVSRRRSVSPHHQFLTFWKNHSQCFSIPSFCGSCAKKVKKIFAIM